MATLVAAVDIAGAIDKVWQVGFITKLRAEGVQGALLHLLEDSGGDRWAFSRPSPVHAFVHQGWILGSLMWLINMDNLLRELSALTVAAYVNDCTLFCSYSRSDSQRVIDKMNWRFRLAEIWGEVWLVSSAPEKTQGMVICLPGC